MPERAKNTLDIHAVVRIEPYVLSGNDGLLYVSRNVGKRNPDAIFQPMDIGKHGPIIIIYQRTLGNVIDLLWI